MRLSFIYTTVLICVLITSCSKPNGKYVVIKVDDTTSGNDTINSVLKNRLLGKEFDIIFTNEYALMEDSEHNKAYMPIEKKIYTSSDCYQKKASLNRVSYIASLYKRNDGKLMYVLRADGRVNDIFYPIQLGNLPPWGEVRCWLVKIDK